MKLSKPQAKATTVKAKTKAPPKPPSPPRRPPVGDDRGEPDGDMRNTVAEIRRRNLMWLRLKFEELELMRSPPPPDSKANPSRGMDRRFAEYLGMPDPKYFGHVKRGRRNVGNQLARDVERVWRLPKTAPEGIPKSLQIGWMDAEHAEAASGDHDEDRAVALMLRVYRSDPAGAGRILMKALQDHLGRPDR